MPQATSFDAPNGFASGTRSGMITVLRFANVGAALDIRLPATTPRQLGNAYSHDREMGRLAISTARYNTAVIRPVSQHEGGIDIVRLFDGQQRPLMTLGGGSASGAATGVRLTSSGTPALDTQTGSNWRWRVPAMNVAGNRRNRAGTFTVLSAGATMRSARKHKASVRISHRFSYSAIETDFRIRRGNATDATVRVPLWGSQSTIEVVKGARRQGKQVRRTSGTLLLRMHTLDGARMLVALRGIPSRATIVVARHRRSAKAPAGAQELRVRFRLRGQTTKIQRRIAVVPASP